MKTDDHPASAGAALLALAAFRNSPEGEIATAADTTIVKVRRSTSVVLALAEATWTVLDALTLVTGRRVNPVVAASCGLPPPRPRRSGRPPTGTRGRAAHRHAPLAIGKVAPQRLLVRIDGLPHLAL